jgi:hypothetical protein
LKVAGDAQSDRYVEIATETTVQLVEELIRADRRITIDSVAAALRCPHGLEYSVMHDRLKFQTVCVWWVPRELKAMIPASKQAKTVHALDHLATVTGKIFTYWRKSNLIKFILLSLYPIIPEIVGCEARLSSKVWHLVLFGNLPGVTGTPVSLPRF